MLSGIYQIRNLVNGKIYIGSSKNIKSRWNSHKTDINKKKHHSNLLQKAWYKYGEENFVFEVLATCPPEYLIKLEQWFLDNLKPEYNICKIARSVLGLKRSEETKMKMALCKLGNTAFKGRKHTEETKQKMRISFKKPKSEEHRRKNTERLHQHRYKLLKPILQYNLDGSFVQEWDSIKSIVETLNIHRMSIQNCITGRQKKAKGFIWKYKNKKG